MIGSLLAGTIEAPGAIIYGKDGNSYKTYRGMASQEAQIDWRGKTASVEGISTVVATKGPLAHTMDKITLGIRSGFSYTGARTIEELRAKAKFIRQTTAGLGESETHILSRRGS
jgi:IMP dehydrogenase